MFATLPEAIRYYRVVMRSPTGQEMTIRAESPIRLGGISRLLQMAGVYDEVREWDVVVFEVNTRRDTMRLAA